MNDIQMNSEQIWSVPDSFTGTITGTKLEETETPTLYDKGNGYNLHIQSISVDGACTGRI